MKYTIVTTPSIDGKITQEMIIDYGHSNLSESVFRSVMDTQEQQTFEALIKLGWTPPKDDGESVK